MQEILSGIIFGIGVSVPIGPVNILIMSYALKSYKKAFFLGLGAMGADALYLTLLSFGILKFLNSPTGFKILAVFGAIFLTYMAILILKNSKSNIKMQKTDSFSLFGIFVNSILVKQFRCFELYGRKFYTYIVWTDNRNFSLDQFISACDFQSTQSYRRKNRKSFFIYFRFYFDIF